MVNFHLGFEVESDYQAISEAAMKVVAQSKFETFAVRARRGEKEFPMTSEEVNRELGAKIVETTGKKVKLKGSDLTVFIEILNKRSFVSGEKTPGPGGLPVGSAGRVACLLSGGIDSPVAAYRLMKRGCIPFFVHFHSSPFTSRASVEKVLDLAEHLCVGQAAAKIALVGFGELQKKLIQKIPDEYRVLFYRRFMLRIATELAKEHKCEALVTGEALSQVASQTLSNLATIETVTDLPVLRPLVGMDKQEIVNEAEKIGTFKTACEPHDDCCSFLVPRHPVTKTNLKQVERIEARLDVEGLLDMARSDIEYKDISAT